MKFGILTFHEADSYGAVLQAYALQQTLLKLGADSEFVQIRNLRSEENAPPATGVAAVFARRMQAESQKRAALFTQFRQEYMNISRIYDPAENIDGDYDGFIAGSDQIWNFRIPGADSRYFLPFAKPEKRNSYAASFGQDCLPEKTQNWVAGQLSKFQNLSVREESGCQIIKDLINRDAEVCLDPTLLPDQSDWEALTQTDDTAYVLLFMLKYDADLLEDAKKEAEKRGIPLRVITAAFMPQVGMNAWNTTGVNDWLSAIRNAQCVFTNSFHGMVFSMIFRRSFRVALLTGELSTRNGRLSEMLAFLKLTEALSNVVEPDYSAVWSRIEFRKNASMDYLRSIIHDTAT